MRRRCRWSSDDGGGGSSDSDDNDERSVRWGWYKFWRHNETLWTRTTTSIVVVGCCWMLLVQGHKAREQKFLLSYIRYYGKILSVQHVPKLVFGLFPMLGGAACGRPLSFAHRFRVCISGIVCRTYFYLLPFFFISLADQPLSLIQFNQFQHFDIDFISMWI